MSRGVRQEQLDFLRGIAATYVLINHSRGQFFVGGRALLAENPSLVSYLKVAMLQATSLGVEMVTLFFVLSGFAMAHSVRHSSSTGRFYLKRIVRIWPPYIAATLLAFAVGMIVAAPFDPLPVLFYINPSTGLTPQFWSLPYEIVFYALCPLVAARYFKAFAAAALAGTAATLALRGPMLNPWPSLFLNFAGNEALLFVCGIAAYRHFDRLPRVGGRALLAIVGAAFLTVWALDQWLGGPNIFANAVTVAAAVLAIRNLPDRIPKWANLGEFSYSIYIFHFALIALLAVAARQAGLDPRTANPFLWVPVAVAVLGACYALYFVTERISNNWVRALRSGTRLTHQPGALSSDPR